MGKVATILCLVLAVSKYALAIKEPHPDEDCDERRILTLHHDRDRAFHKHTVGENQVIVDVKLLGYPTPPRNCIKGKNWSNTASSLTVKWNCSGTFELCIKNCDKRRILTLHHDRERVIHKHAVGANEVIVGVKVLDFPTPPRNCIKGKNWLSTGSSLTVKWNCSATFELCIKDTDPTQPDTTTITTSPVTTSGQCDYGSVQANDDCTGYYVCIGGNHVLQYCPWTLKYSAKQQRCVSPQGENFNCDTSVHFHGTGSSTGGQQTTETTPSAGNCAHGSVQANDECTGYYTCIGGLRVLQLCQWTLKYSAQEEKCVYPEVDEPFYCDTRVHYLGTGSSTIGQQTTGTTPPTGNCLHGSVQANEECTGYFACIGGIRVLQLCPWTLKYSAQQEKCVYPDDESFYCDTRVHYLGTGSSTVGQQTTGTTPPTDELDCDTQKTVSCGTNGQQEKTCNDLLDAEESAILCASLIHTASNSICEPQKDWFYHQSSITVKNGCSATFDLCIKNCDKVIHLTCEKERCFTYTKGKIIRAEREGNYDYCKGKFMFGNNFIEIADPACVGVFWLCIAQEHY